MRFLKDKIREFLHRRGYELYRRPWLPKGTDAFESLRAEWEHWQPRVIFDVGANVGQTVKRLRPLFPTAQIHAFEPVPSTFAQLQANVRGDPLTQCHPLALAERAGTITIKINAKSELNSLSPALRDAADLNATEVALTLDTTAGFCARHGITHIDLLKIDVEGFELAVLEGTVPLFSVGAVDYIVAEAGLMPNNPRFTPLPAMIDFLLPHGFWLVGVYEQMGHHYRQGGEYCNALFTLKKNFI